MPAIVTDLALREADSLLGALCELLVESLEASLPPLKAFLAIPVLSDLGPLVPEWGGSGEGPDPEPPVTKASDACGSSGRATK